MASPFFDTNILVHLIAGDPRRAARSREVMGRGGVVSVQVLNEFASVARRKHALNWNEVEEWLVGFRRGLHVEPLTVLTQAHAIAIASRHRLEIYDATILAAAEQAGCDTVYTEDLHDGAAFAGLTIRNPY